MGVRAGLIIQMDLTTLDRIHCAVVVEVDEEADEYYVCETRHDVKFKAGGKLDLTVIPFKKWLRVCNTSDENTEKFWKEWYKLDVEDFSGRDWCLQVVKRAARGLHDTISEKDVLAANEVGRTAMDITWE